MERASSDVALDADHILRVVSEFVAGERKTGKGL